MNITLTDRSRIETFEHCPRKRYWTYEHESRGLEKADSLKIDARYGTWVHNGIENGLKQGTECSPKAYSAVALLAGESFVDDCKSVVDWAGTTDQMRADITEGGQIVTALTYAWLRVKAPRLLEDGEILGIEKELTVDFGSGSPSYGHKCNETVVRLMARPDIIWKRKADGTIFVRNLKTVRKADTRWREKWTLDMQTMTEPLAVDKWLQDTVPDLVCGGVIIDGLVTGEVLFDKYRGLYYHNNPLIYAWHQADESVLGGAGIFYSRYEWSCTEPHVLGNGHKCPGGKAHKLGRDIRKVSVADKYPGGVIAWVDNLIATDKSLVDEMLIELPPIIRDEYQIARWKRQVLPREVEIKSHARLVNNADVNLRELTLDAYFPMHTANGNCLYPGKCVAFDLCHGTADADPLSSGYVYRKPNHPEGE